MPALAPALPIPEPSGAPQARAKRAGAMSAFKQATSFREAAKMQGRKAAMERAREALLKKKADLASSRVIALEDSPTVVQG